jgi:hypothetical protein
MYLVLNRGPTMKRPTQEAIEWATMLMAFASVVLRAEVAAFALPWLLNFVWMGYVGMKSLLRVGIVWSILSIR